MRRYQFVGGMRVSEAARKLVDLANQHGVAYSGDFNEIQLVANPGDSAHDVEDAWQRESDRRAEAYRNSPEGKAREAEREARYRQLRQSYEQALADLEQLDFNDVAALIDWLDRLVEPNEIGIAFRWLEITEKFREHGYLPNANTGDAFDRHDKENYARWLIGQALAFLRGDYLGVHGVHPTFSVQADKWRRQFAVRSGR